MLTRQDQVRRLVRIRQARESFPALSAYSIRRMIRAGIIEGFRPTRGRLLLVDLDQLERAVVEDGKVTVAD